MKNLFFTAFLLLCSTPAFAQEITEENYYTEYEAVFERTIGKTGMNSQSHKALMEGWAELAIKYVSLPDGVCQLFYARQDMPEERLREAYNALTDEQKQSQWGRNILFYLDTDHDKYFDFEATTDAGEPFRLSSLAGKNVLFLYEGLDCMQEFLLTLNDIYAKSSHEQLEIVAYCECDDLEQLKTIRKDYPNDFIIVSDFLGDASPVTAIYSGNETPVGYFIDSDGTMHRGLYYEYTIGRLFEFAGYR